MAFLRRLRGELPQAGDGENQQASGAPGVGLSSHGSRQPLPRRRAYIHLITQTLSLGGSSPILIFWALEEVIDPLQAPTVKPSRYSSYVSTPAILALHATMTLTLFGLMGAYAAGSSRRLMTCAYILALVIGVSAYIVVLVFVSVARVPHPVIGFMDMSDDEKEVGGGTTTRGADWQVVTLTASAYEAAPGPAGTEGKPITQEHSSSNALLISDHFVFPPSEHENLPIQTSFDEIQPEKDVQKASTSEEDYSIKNDVRSERVQFYDEGKNLSADDAEMGDEASVYNSSHAEDDVHDFAAHADGNEAGEDFDEKSDQPLKPSDSESCDTGASCKCWLKKHMACMYHQAKEANAIWSVVVAAALVGIVILGHWHKDKLRIDQLRWRFGSAVRG
ncbi:hypothetical protein BS78_06G026100 [Paspalum vaginatum]|nr:hypothetical protein BS78_06G026100 [Paspalum vaginatum]